MYQNTFLYMNIIQRKTYKISTDELYCVHCVNIPSFFTSCAKFGQFKAKQVLSVASAGGQARNKNKFGE